MDAGVPIKAPVAGIAMGLIKEGDRVAVLSDILGDEDHLGDMDFKVCGTKQGITAIQMDIKIEGLTREILEKALARRATAGFTSSARWPRRCRRRATICRATRRASHDPGQARPDPRHHRPRRQDDPRHRRADRRRDRRRGRRHGHIASPDGSAVKKAIDIIKGLTTEPEVGEFYKGVVKRIADFGAFVEIMPGTDGLLHISELDAKRVRACRTSEGRRRGDGEGHRHRPRRQDPPVAPEALGKTPDVVHNLRTAAAS